MTAASPSLWTATSTSSRAGRGQNSTPASTASLVTQFSGANLDNLMLVSGVEAPPTVRLFNLWIEQDLTSNVKLRIGQFTAAQEFIVSRNADLFVNSTFGWPMLNTQNLPSGGPNYPEAALGARLQIKLQRPVHSAGCDLRRRSGRVRLQQSGDERQIWARFPPARPALCDRRGGLWVWGRAAFRGPAKPEPRRRRQARRRRRGRPAAGGLAVGAAGRCQDRRLVQCRFVSAARLHAKRHHAAAAPRRRSRRCRALSRSAPGTMPVRFRCKTSRKAAQCHRKSKATQRSMACSNRRSGACPAAQPRARFLCARRRRAQRPQRDRSLCRWRFYLPRAARLAAGGHRRTRLRLRPHFARRGRQRPRARGAHRRADADPRL